MQSTKSIYLIIRHDVTIKITCSSELWKTGDNGNDFTLAAIWRTAHGARPQGSKERDTSQLLISDQSPDWLVLNLPLFAL